MSQVVIGECFFKGVHLGRAFKRYVDQQIAQWLRRVDGYVPDDVFYTASFSHPSTSDVVTCDLEVRIDAHILRGEGRAAHPELALVKAMNALTPQVDLMDRSENETRHPLAYFG